MNSARTVLGLNFLSTALAYSIGGSSILTIGTGGIINSSANSQAFSAPVAVGGIETWNAASGNLNFSGIISGSSALTLAGGAGKQITFSGASANTFSGALAINSGQLNANKAGALGSASSLSIASGGTFSAGAAISYANAISGAGSVTFSGANSLTLSGNNTFSGSFGVANGGTLNANSASALGSGSVTLTSGTMNIGANVSTPGGVSFAGGTLAVNDTAAARTASFGALALGAGSTIDLTDNGTSSSLTFSSATRSAGGLTINNWVNTSSRDKIFISSTPNAAFLLNVTFNGFGSGGQINAGGELGPAGTTPVPEPNEYAMMFGLGLFGFAIYRRRTQKRS